MKCEIFVRAGFYVDQGVRPLAGSSDYSYGNAGPVNRGKWLDFLVNTNL
jgi:hypothetical protein